MAVVNCKVQYIRPRYANLAEWMADGANVYIGRRGVVFITGRRFPAESSPFANPYKIGKDGTRKEVLAKYKQYMIAKLENGELLAELAALRGKNLGCWCHPEGCHGSVLLELIDTYVPR